MRQPYVIKSALKSRLAHIRLQPFLICLSLATWLYAAQIGSWNREKNRYHDFWGCTDAFAIILGLLGTTIVLWLAYLFISRTKWRILRSIGQYCFVLLLIDVGSWLVLKCIGAGFVARYDWIFIGVWIAIAGSVYVLRRFAFEVGKVLALITSPLPGLVLPLMLSWPSYEPGRVVQAPPRQLSSQKCSVSAAPVYIFVFDEWSYERSFQAGNPRPELENLAAFCSTATVLHAATAPANSTFESLPRIVFQQAEGELLLASGGQIFWEIQGQKKALDDLPTLFDGLLERGYRVRLLGFYHPYPLLLRDKSIAAQSFSIYPKTPSLLGRTCELAVYNLRFLTDPVSRELSRRIMARHYCRYWSQLVNHFLCETQTILAEGGSHEAAFFHWPLPHAPFIFDEDGRYLGPYDPYCERMYGTPAQYERHLRFLDCVIGQIMDQLKQRDRFEESLIVLTSDHSWRRETDPGLKAKSRDCRRVPLLVKFPGQSSRLDRDDPFPLARLRELIDGVVSTR